MGGATRRSTVCPDTTLLQSRRAGDRVAARADTGAAGVGLGARIAVVAGRSVRRLWVRAHTRRWVAGSRHMALIARRADDRVGAGAETRAAGVGLSARIAVVAGRPVRLVRVGAGAGGGVAGPGDVALGARRAAVGVDA